MGRHNPITDVERTAIIRLYLTGGRTYSQIARKVGRSYQSVYKIVRESREASADSPVPAETKSIKTVLTLPLPDAEKLRIIGLLT